MFYPKCYRQEQCQRAFSTISSRNFRAACLYSMFSSSLYAYKTDVCLLETVLPTFVFLVPLLNAGYMHLYVYMLSSLFHWSVSIFMPTILYDWHIYPFTLRLENVILPVQYFLSCSSYCGCMHVLEKEPSVLFL